MSNDVYPMPVADPEFVAEPLFKLNQQHREKGWNYPQIRVTVHLYSQSQPIVLLDISNTYQKGDMFCALQNENGTVYKFPMQHIFRVIEEDQNR